MHIVSACSMLAQKDKRRHDKVCLKLHWTLCRKYDLEVSKKLYQHKVDSVVENEMVKILWDFTEYSNRSGNKAQKTRHRRSE